MQTKVLLAAMLPCFRTVNPSLTRNLSWSQRSLSRFDLINKIVPSVQSQKQAQMSNMLTFNGLWRLRTTTEGYRVSTAALCTVHNLGNRFGRMDPRSRRDPVDLMRPGLPQPVHTDSDGEEKQKGWRERGRNRRGNEYLTVTHGVKERNVSLADLLVFFIPPLQLARFSSTPELRSMPIEICKHNSLGNRIERFRKESAFGLSLLCGVKSMLKTSEREIYAVCQKHEGKLELSIWNHNTMKSKWHRREAE